MTEWVVVRSSEEPSEFDLVSSPTTVYQHRNIHTVEEHDEMSDITVTMFEHEERKMSRSEYMDVYAEPMKASISNIEDALCDLDM